LRAFFAFGASSVARDRMSGQSNQPVGRGEQHKLEATPSRRTAKSIVGLPRRVLRRRILKLESFTVAKAGYLF